jgi:preprotein translocase subunit SecG
MSRKNDDALFSKEVEKEEESKCLPQYVPWSNPIELCKKKNATLHCDEEKEEIKAADPPGHVPWSKLNAFGARKKDKYNASGDLDINNEIDIENPRASGGGHVVSTSNDLDESPGAAALGNIAYNPDVPEETSNPRTPETVFPGAFRVAGLNQKDGYEDDDELTITIGETGISLEAELVDAEEEEKRLDDKINQALQRERQVVQDQINQTLQRENQQGVVRVGLQEQGVISNTRGMRWKLVGAVLILILILIVVAVVLGIMLRPGDKTSAPTSAPTQAPTTLAPTKAPTTSAQALTELLSSASFDDGEALKNSLTPQYTAMDWLAGNRNFLAYSDQQKIQRYALATLFYSTGGDGWNSTGLWLDDGDECNRWSGIDCTGGAVHFLVFGSNNLQGTIPPEIAMLSDSLGEWLIIEEKTL